MADDIEALGNSFLQDYNVNDLPASGAKNPRKVDGRTTFAAIEARLAGVEAGSVPFANKAAMDADLNWPAGTEARVYGDVTTANNGVYKKAGASGAGSWGSKLAAIPGTDISAITSEITAGRGGETDLNTRITAVSADADTALDTGLSVGATMRPATTLVAGLVSDTLTTIIAAGTAPTKKKRRRVTLPAGTWTQNGISGRAFTDLIGAGLTLSVIDGSLPANTSISDISAKSTLDWYFDGDIEGVTAIAKNCRYAVHADNFNNPANLTQFFRDCVFVHNGNQAAIDYQTGLGGGGNPGGVWPHTAAFGGACYNGGRVEIHRCTIIGDRLSAAIHNRAAAGKRSVFRAVNSTFAARQTFTSSTVGVAFEAFNLGSGFADSCELIGNTFQGDIFIHTDNWNVGDLSYQPADHNEWRISGHGNSPAVVRVSDFGRALLIESAATTGTTSIALSGTAVAAIFGGVVAKAGAGGFKGYARGTFDIQSTTAVGPSNNLFITSLGKRLGDCTSVNKVLTILVNGVTELNVVFNTNHTSDSNAAILAKINTVLGSYATASEYNVGARYRPMFADEERVYKNGSATGIPFGSPVAFDSADGSKSVRLMTNSDPTHAFAGIAWEDIYPGEVGRVKIRGFLSTADLRRSDATALVVGDYLSASVTGFLAKSNAVPVLQAIRPDAVRFLAGASSADAASALASSVSAGASAASANADKVAASGSASSAAASETSAAASALNASQAANLSTISRIYALYSQAITDFASIPANAKVEITFDETRLNKTAWYQKVGASLNFIAELDIPVRYDAAQSLTSGQKLQACVNIGSLYHANWSQNVLGTGTPGITNGELFFNRTEQVGAWDGSPTVRIDRRVPDGANAGSAGTVKALWIYSEVGKNSVGFEWTVTAELHNKALGSTNSENVALNGTAFVEANGEGPTGKTWGANLVVNDQTGEANPTYARVGCEIDCWVSAGTTDSNRQRVGLHIATGGVSGAWVGTALLIGPTPGSWIERGIVFGNAVLDNSQTNYVLGIDMSRAKFTSAAILMAAGHYIGFDGAASNQAHSHKLYYSGGILAYDVAGTIVARVSDAGRLSTTGGLETGGTIITGTVTTGSSTPTLNANKPGSNANVIAWEQRSVSGTTGWVPIFGN